MMTLTETKSPKRRAVGTETISDDSLRLDVLILQWPTQEPEGGFGIAPLLDDHVHHLPFVIYGAPDPHVLADNRRDHLVEMPTRRWR